MKSVHGLICVMLLTAIACRNQTSALSPSEIPAWRAALQHTRAEKDHAFKTDPTSPMAGIARWSLEPDEPVTVSEGPEGLTYAPGKGTPLVTFQRSDDDWQWTGRTDTVQAFLNNTQVTESGIRPGMIFHLNPRFTLEAYPGEHMLTLLVFDRDRPERNAFSGLKYFDPDPAYVIDATVERLSQPDTVTMLTSRNLKKTYFRYAILHFRLNGTPCKLTAYKMHLKGAYEHLLFIPFRDTTSGVESYGAGRYLELKEPSSDHIRLDFNQAFNPLCNYSPAYNCPVPPAENTLLIPVRAGEKTYPIHHQSKIP